MGEAPSGTRWKYQGRGAGNGHLSVLACGRCGEPVREDMEHTWERITPSWRNFWRQVCTDDCPEGEHLHRVWNCYRHGIRSREFKAAASLRPNPPKDPA